MGSSNKTTNVNLSQFSDSDKPSWRGDYNVDMLRIDNGIAAVQDSADTALASINSAITLANQANANTDSVAGDLLEFAGTVYSKNDSDARYPAVADVFTKSQSDARYPTVADVFSKAESNSRFALKPDVEHAVFIGSSNAENATGWTGTLANREGWVHHNYAVGGGGFTFAAPYAFSDQVSRAINDASYDHSLVKHFFVVDAGNDIRNMKTTVGYADPLWQQIRVGFPNAEIYCIPALWGITADNLIPGRMFNLTKVAQELRDSCINNNVNYLDNSWTWHYDNSGYMAPSSVHYSSVGYTLIASMVRQFLKTGNSIRNIGRKPIPPAGAGVSASTVLGAREGNVVSLLGTYKTSGNTGEFHLNNVPLLMVPEGMRPANIVYAEVLGNNQSRYQVEIYPSGEFRTWSPSPGTPRNETFNVNINYAIW